MTPVWRTWPLLITTFLTSLAPVAQAQVNLEAQDPEGAFLAFFRAFAQGRWEEAVALLDVTALDQYRRELVTNAKLQPPRHQLTVDDLLQQDPDMPRAVAEYQLARINKDRASAGNYLSFEFAGVQDAAQLDTMPVAQVAARWLTAQHPATRLKDELLRKGCRILPGLDAAIEGPSVAVLGTVERPDGTAFVLFADTSLSRQQSGFHAPAPQIAYLKRFPAGWRVLPRYDLIQPANTFVHFVACPERSPRD